MKAGHRPGETGEKSMHQLWAEMDRRLLMKLGTAGLAAMALPGAAQAMAAQGFTHGLSLIHI